MNSRWNSSIYNGPLNNYTYPEDKEFGNLLQFLQQINSNQAAKIHISDVCDWNMSFPNPNFDIYIVCAFGEFINETHCHKLDTQFADRHLILLTSQYYNPCNLKNFKVFVIEHLHTAVRFFQPNVYPQLSQRTYMHATQSRRNALHKSLITQKLLSSVQNLQYTFCNRATSEYSLDKFRQNLREILAMDCSDQEINLVESLHRNPIEIQGNDWDITPLYYNSKIFWVTESIFLSRNQCPTAYLTEKILKPIISGNVWILCGQKHSYQRTSNLGFETFESDFVINWDSCSDQERMSNIYSLIDNCDFETVVTKIDLQEKINYNYNHFFYNFVSHVEKENLPKIQQFVDYVNKL